MNPKPNITYPQTTGIYETEHEGKRAFMLIMGDDTTIPSKIIQPNDTKDIEKRVSELETVIKEISGKISLK